MCLQLLSFNSLRGSTLSLRVVGSFQGVSEVRLWPMCMYLMPFHAIKVIQWSL